MGDSPLIIDWINKAETDMKCAKILFEHDGGNDAVAFHCQQAIEKALKAIILYLFSTLESGHSLLYLCKKVITKLPQFSTYLEGCIFVNQYYIETRYPNETPVTVSNEEAMQCLKYAENVLCAVKANIE